MTERKQGELRRGWTTGACACAAARSAYAALLTGSFLDPVEIVLPGGQRPSFALAMQRLEVGAASAGIVKDAGDDPDVTHGALVVATVRHGRPGAGVVFRAGAGVGTVTRPGLPIPPGEPAINPVPRDMIRAAIAGLAASLGGSGDVVVEISVPGGAAIAEKTWNPRLGIIGGISILGTTGIVIPYSCAAWIASIHRGIDVARAGGLAHIAGATGATSEAAVQRLHGLPLHALIDMGDFVGGMLKYARTHPVQRITIAGGFAKMTKLGQGLLDLHSRSGEVDRGWLAGLIRSHGGPEELAERALGANTAKQVLDEAAGAGVPLGHWVAAAALVTARGAIGGAQIVLDVAVFDREGGLVGSAC